MLYISSSQKGPNQKPMIQVFVFIDLLLCNDEWRLILDGDLILHSYILNVEAQDTHLSVYLDFWF